MTPRVVLAGNGATGVGALRLLLEAVPREALLVVAPPGGPKHAWQADLAGAARTAGVRVLDPADVNAPDVAAEVVAHRADLLLSACYTQLFRRPLLESAPLALNVHPSLLPRHRGTAPVVWAIAEGDTRTGVTLHHLDAGVDTGAAVARRQLPVHPQDTGFSLHDKAARLAVALVAEVLRDWLAGRPLPVADAVDAQPCLHRSTDAPLNPLDLSQPASRVRDVVRALAPPFPGAHLVVDGRRLVVAEATPVDADVPAGRLVRRGGDALVRAGDGALRLDRLVLAGQVVPAPRHPVAEGALS